jgi:hypothetical protein
MTRREHCELQFISLQTKPYKSDSALCSSLEKMGYILLTRSGYVITSAGLKALEEERKS